MEASDRVIMTSEYPRGARVNRGRGKKDTFDISSRHSPCQWKQLSVTGSSDSDTPIEETFKWPHKQGAAAASFNSVEGCCCCASSSSHCSHFGAALGSWGSRSQAHRGLGGRGTQYKSI
ncbi:unnamed protein product [Pleuronectes platessa]|uniref:Uncharacterized protein n=1 Tax=Pleuronectes platessa TaxID=8262 RepID=A0A9N7UIZ0_PLEPL|nr:unnamed protein product [Pleuronectes platessa]